MDHSVSEEKDIVVEERHYEDIDDNSLVLTEPVQSEPFVLPHREREDGQSMVQTIIMVIGAIILVVLLVLFARWIYHKVHNSSAEDTSAGTLQLPESGNTYNPQSNTNQPTGSPNSTTTPPASNPQTTGGKSIANTGPGNVVAVFAASTLAAAGLHYIVSLRRFNKFGN